MAKDYSPTVELEQTTYYYLAHAHVVYEKAKYVQLHLREAIAALESPPVLGSAGEAGNPSTGTPMEI